MAKEMNIDFTKFAGMKFMACQVSAFPKSTISARLYSGDTTYFDLTALAFSNSPFLTVVDLKDIAGKKLTLTLKSSQDLHLKTPELLLAPAGGNAVGVSYTVLASTGKNDNYNEFYLFISAWRSKG